MTKGFLLVLYHVALQFRKFLSLGKLVVFFNFDREGLKKLRKEMDKELGKLAKRINYHQEKLQSLETAFFIKRFFSLPATRKRVRLLQEIFDAKLKKWLLGNDTEFKRLAQENLKLLQREKIIYRTKSATYSPVGTYSAYFSGKIFPNGYGQLDLKATNLGVYPLAKHDYVAKYLGYIDYMGNIELKPVKIESALMYSRPNTYQGYVNDKGVIVLEIVKRDLETLSGHVVIVGMIGLHFSDNQPKEQFFDNRKKLTEIIDKAKKQFFEQGKTK